MRMSSYCRISQTRAVVDEEQKKSRVYDFRRDRGGYHSEVSDYFTHEHWVILWPGLGSAVRLP